MVQAHQERQRNQRHSLTSIVMGSYGQVTSSWKFSRVCNKCRVRYFKSDDPWGSCNACSIEDEQARCHAKFAQVASDAARPWSGPATAVIVACLAGDLSPAILLRNRRRDTLHIFLESPGQLRQLRYECDHCQHYVAVEYRDSLLTRVISFLI